MCWRIASRVELSGLLSVLCCNHLTPVQDCKQGVKGLHFLAVQPDPDSDELNGMWLLQDRPIPSI